MTVEIHAKVSNIIAQVIGKTVEEIKSEALFADLGIDEFDLIEIIMKVEDQFNIIVDDGKIADFSNVQNIIDVVSNLL